MRAQEIVLRRKEENGTTRPERDSTLHAQHGFYLLGRRTPRFLVLVGHPREISSTTISKKRRTYERLNRQITPKNPEAHNNKTFPSKSRRPIDSSKTSKNGRAEYKSKLFASFFPDDKSSYYNR